MCMSPQSFTQLFALSTFGFPESYTFTYILIFIGFLVLGGFFIFLGITLTAIPLIDEALAAIICGTGAAYWAFNNTSGGWGAAILGFIGGAFCGGLLWLVAMPCLVIIGGFIILIDIAWLILVMWGQGAP